MATKTIYKENRDDDDYYLRWRTAGNRLWGKEER